MIEEPLTVVGHLSELRQRIIISLVAVLIIAFFTFMRAGDIIQILKYPSQGIIDKLVFFSPTEAFSAYFKVAFFSALVLGSPVLLYQLWAFLSPAIGGPFKKHAAIFLVSGTLAFILGVSFGYFFLLPAAIKFLLGFSSGVLVPMISVSEYLSFVIGLLLACGLVFEMPVLSFLLAKIGILDYRLLRKNWKYAVVIIFIIAAIVTPTPDAFNMCLMAMPMLILYEISIWVAKFSGKSPMAQDTPRL